MSSIKTAISLEKRLYDEIEKLIHKMHISRSKFFSTAAKEFIKKNRNKELLNKLNKVYANTDNQIDKNYIGISKKHHFDNILEKW